MSILFSIALLKIVNFFSFVCFIAPRSGLAAKHFIDVGAGVIDEKHRGNVGVVLLFWPRKV